MALMLKMVSCGLCVDIHHKRRKSLKVRRLNPKPDNLGGNTGPQDNRNTMSATEEILGWGVFFFFGQTSFQEEANFRGVGHHFFNVVSFSEANIMGEKKSFDGSCHVLPSVAYLVRYRCGRRKKKSAQQHYASCK